MCERIVSLQKPGETGIQEYRSLECGLESHHQSWWLEVLQEDGDVLNIKAHVAMSSTCYIFLKSSLGISLSEKGKEREQDIRS